MNDVQILTALEVMRAGSMTRAAGRLGVTQPAVKKQIDALETELGVRLFERNRHGCAPTEAGRVFCEGMERISAEVADLLESVSRAGVGGAELALCTLPGVISPNFAEICRDLTQSHPEVRLRYIPMPYAERPRAIAEGHADVGAYFDVPEVLGRYGLAFWPGTGAFAARCAQAGALCLVSPESRLARLRRVTPDDLAGIDLAAFDARPFAGAFPGRDIRSVSGDEFAVLSLCEAGGAYLTCHLAERYTTLRAVPLDVRLPAEGFVTRAEPPYPARLFLNAVARVLGEARP